MTSSICQMFSQDCFYMVCVHTTFKIVQNPEETNTNFSFDTDTSLRHYHHNNHNDHYTNYIDLYIDHFYSETANSNSNIALLMTAQEVVL